MGLFGGNKNIDIPLLNLASEGWKTYAEEFKKLAPDANVGVLETSEHAIFMKKSNSIICSRNLLKQ